MARRIELTPEARILHEIGALAGTQLRPEANVRIQCYYFTDLPHTPTRAYVSFEWSPGCAIPQRLTHKPGIPPEALLPEKVRPIAEWIVRQIRKERPAWFIDND